MIRLPGSIFQARQDIFWLKRRIVSQDFGVIGT
jgi:hypothetical protein